MGLNHFGMASNAEAEASTVPSVEILKNSALLLPVEIVAGRDAITVAIDLGPDHDELVGLGVGHRGDQSGVHNAENGGVGADTEGERE